MRKAIYNLFPLSDRISQYKDVLMLTAHSDKKLYQANKEVLWYRGTDNYKQVFRAILSKFNKHLPVLADDCPCFVDWENSSEEAKAIIIYLGFHSASTNNNVRITSLIQSYRYEISSFFDFSYDEFIITSLGRMLLSELYKSNLAVKQRDVRNSTLQLQGTAIRTQQKLVVESKNVIFSGKAGMDALQISLYQTLHNKDFSQGVFVIHKNYSPDAAISVNQHAYNNGKQYEFFMDSPSVVRKDFSSIATQVCQRGGYYYGNAIKNTFGKVSNNGENYTVNVLTCIANAIDELDEEAQAPIVFVDLGSFKDALTHQVLATQIKRLFNSKAKVCLYEPEPVEECHYYNAFILKYNALHMIARSSTDDRLPSKVSKGTLKNSQVDDQFFVKSKEGLQCEGGLVALDYEQLSMQVKGRFIRIF
jgi:hypothetical protein